MPISSSQLLLYAVTDRSWLNGASLYSQVEAALKGGVTCLQLREKDLDAADFIREAKKIKPLAERYQVPFIINDNIDVALAVNADGVHIGQSDAEVRYARRLLGADKILGVSAQTVDQALQAQDMGADYLGVGAVFATASKADADNLSVDILQKICAAVSIPLIAIGGITKDNICLLQGSGICGVAVISAIFGQKDIPLACDDLLKALQALRRPGA